ncbi:Tyrosine--tRNA ligase (Tyr-tRNA) [Candidatus Vidania fulgoroideae]|nr:Tyrosine--tRNA ligase (Tyr-tRNA) [Candidatus Vidania fulgoroideae]
MKKTFSNFFTFKKILKMIKKKSSFFKKERRMKFGIDLTKSSLHIGHLFILLFIKKILRFRKLKIFLILGDFTTYINNNIKKKKILKNLKKIKKQIKKILGENKRIKYLKNSSWLEKIKFGTISKLEIDFFLKRKKIVNEKEKKIGQIVYPYFQNFDNKILEIDTEIGGRDQFFNFIYGNKKKIRKTFFFVLPLIRGIKGNEKMSKSDKKNQINLSDNCKTVFWKFISMNDVNSKRNYSIFSRVVKFKKKKNNNINKEILRKINLFLNIGPFFLKKNDMDSIIKKYIKKKYTGIKKTFLIEKKTNIIDFFIEKKILYSRKEVKNLIKQGSIKVNNNIIKEFNFCVGDKDVVSYGKKKRYLLKIEK